MMIYAELIDTLADRIYKVASKLEMSQYDFGYLQAVKDIRRDIIDMMDKDLNGLSDEINVDTKK
jgi:hypothetical protein